MKGLNRGLLLALFQALVALTLLARASYDRVRLPRVWVRTVSRDPDNPFRGRYIALRIGAIDRRGDSAGISPSFVRLSVEDGELVARPGDPMHGMRIWNGPVASTVATDSLVLLDPPLAFFIPSSAPDPSLRPPDDPLWVEVSVPGTGPPRPIRLGLSRQGQMVPLEVE